MAALVSSITPPPPKEVIGPELPPLTNGKTEACAQDIDMDGLGSPTLLRPTPRKQPGKVGRAVAVCESACVHVRVAVSVRA